MIATKACQTCDFSHVLDGDRGEVLQCRRNPPTIVPYVIVESNSDCDGLTSVEGHTKPYKEFPLVSPDDWCGQWSRGTWSKETRA